MDQTLPTVMCTHCQVRMTEQLGTGGRVQYFQCGRCQRWVSSTYAEVLSSGDAKFATRPAEQDAARTREFEQVKGRLERWLARLDGDDPYALLGVSPFAPLAEIRIRYREEAFKHHPDRGGCPEKMAALNRAYERVTQHAERKVRPALPPSATAAPTWRPKATAQTSRVYRGARTAVVTE